AIGQPPLPVAGRVLGGGQGLDVAGSAAVEVAGAAVMDGVVEAPVGVRLPDQQRGEAADPEVAAATRQEGAVTAVVEDDEGAQQEAGGGDRQRQGEPDRDVD